MMTRRDDRGLNEALGLAKAWLDCARACGDREEAAAAALLIRDIKRGKKVRKIAKKA